MKRKQAFAACLFLFSFLLPGIVLAQGTIDRSTSDRRLRTLFIRGQVRSAETEMTLDMVRINLERTQGGIVQQKFTDSNGNFEFPGIQAGSYRIVAFRDGYEEKTEEVEVTAIPRANVQVYLQPLHPTTHSASESSVSAQDFNVPKKARKEFEKASNLMEKHQLEESVAHFRKAIEIHPTYYEAYSMLGIAYLDLRNYDDARTSLLKAIELNDKHAKSYFALGGLYNNEKQYQQAEEILLKGLALDDRAWQGHFELGKAYWGMGAFAKAETQAVRARELFDGFPSVHLLLANIFLRKRAYPDALVALDAFLKLEPKSSISDEVRQVADKLRTNLNPTKKP